MSRIADSTIKGFLYQFNLTLAEVLSSEDTSIIQVEGIIEDIDIIEEHVTTAVQCKYHEEQLDYSLSNLYKPILQMLVTYVNSDYDNLTFVLHAHFPNEDKREFKLNENQIKEILSTKNIEYISKYICKISPIPDSESQDLKDVSKKDKKSLEDKEKLKKFYLDNPIEIKEEIINFIENHLVIKFGESYEKLAEKVHLLFIESGFNKEDVYEVFYPNAVHEVAQISIISKNEDRLINKIDFLNKLHSTKKTIISRWTRELKNYGQIMKSKKNQLKINLNKNNRKRYFLIDTKNIKDFNSEIVNFIKDYTDIYCHKPKLSEPVLICLINSDREMIENIAARLYIKSVNVETGYIGSQFFSNRFWESPLINIKENYIQFKVRLCYENDEIINLLNNNKPDDLFIISQDLNDKYDLQDINLEILDIGTLDELKYLLKMNEEVPVIG